MSGEIDPDLVAHIAHLSRLKMNAEQLAGSREHLSAILSYMQQLSEVDTSGVEPTAHPLPVHTVLRDDCIQPSLDPDLAMKNAPGHDDSFFTVPKVLDQEDSN